MELEHIEYAEANGVAYITLDRPNKLNALTRPMWKGLRETLLTADNNDEVKIVLLTGNGKAFCAGDDIKELLAAQDEMVARELFIDCIYGLVETICYLKKPLITGVNGYAFGGGCEIVMLSDIAIATENSTFAVPEASLGAWPPIFSVFGPHLVGFKATHQMTFTNKPIDAATALKIGLISKVIDQEHFQQELDSTIENILNSSPASIRITKETTNKILGTCIYDFHLACQRFSREVAKTHDYLEGVSAFLEKRKATFVGN